MHPDDVIIAIISFACGIAATVMVLCFWLAICEPWLRKRRLEQDVAHLGRQYERQKEIMHLRAVIATTKDAAVYDAALFNLRSLEAHQRMSREVYPLINPPPKKRGPHEPQSRSQHTFGDSWLTSDR